jgi:serine/threonine protein kinase
MSAGTAPFDSSGYTPLFQLGTGISGSVHLYYCHTTSSLRAIKIAHHRDDETANLQQFEREIQAYQRYSHRASVKLFNYGIPPSPDAWRPFVELEFLPGGTLVDHILSCGHPGSRTLDYNVSFCALLGISRAVAALHAEGLTHRDLKPENILLDAQQRPYLADFGFARSLGASENLSLVGTPNYMAPEVFAERYTEAVDVWSFGMVIYSLCTSRAPFDDHVVPNEAEWYNEIVKLLRQGKRVSLGDEFSVFRPLFDSCTDNNPNRRPSMAEVSDMILELARDNRATLSGFDYDEFLRYDAELREPLAWVDHGTIEEVKKARERVPLAATVYGTLLYRNLIENEDRDDGIAWLQHAYQQGCRIAPIILAEIQDETGLDMGVGEWRPEERPVSLVSLLLREISQKMVI